jgi:hypothetical protein
MAAPDGKNKRTLVIGMIYCQHGNTKEFSNDRNTTPYAHFNDQT